MLLQSTSAGIVTLDPGSEGQVSMDWFGEGILSDPFNPQQWLEFTYTCSVAAAFASARSIDGDQPVAGQPLTGERSRPTGLPLSDSNSRASV